MISNWYVRHSRFGFLHQLTPFINQFPCGVFVSYMVSNWAMLGTGIPVFWACCLNVWDSVCLKMVKFTFWETIYLEVHVLNTNTTYLIIMEFTISLIQVCYPASMSWYIQLCILCMFL